MYDTIWGMGARPVRFTRGSRKHRVRHASARRVIETVTPAAETDEVTNAVIVRWVGVDERDRELEIIAVERPDCLLVIHVMPARYRRNG